MADEALFLLLHNEMVSGVYKSAEHGEVVSAVNTPLRSFCDDTVSPQFFPSIPVPSPPHASRGVDKLFYLQVS